MQERQPNREFSQEFYVNRAYYHFVRIANEYGKTPSVITSPQLEELRKVEPRAKKLTEDARTFPAVEIPTETDIEGSYDLISGINYGSGEISIYYEKGERAGSLAIGEDHQTKRIHMLSSTLYKRNFVGGHYVKEHLDNLVPEEPNVKGIVELLIRAEKILKEESMPSEPEKLSAKQKFIKRLERFLISE